MSTSRERRLYAEKINYATDDSKSLRMRLADGNLIMENGDQVHGVTISGSKITFDMEVVYFDDVVALLLSQMKTLPDGEHVRAALRHAIAIADMRAVEKHGYSRSEEEAKLEVPYNAENTTTIGDMMLIGDEYPLA